MVLRKADEKHTSITNYVRSVLRAIPEENPVIATKDILTVDDMSIPDTTWSMALIGDECKWECRRTT
jgi:hypothetical protein